eukprot:8052702-Alexandrium_andersonii.AAC.1
MTGMTGHSPQAQAKACEVAPTPARGGRAAEGARDCGQRVCRPPAGLPGPHPWRRRPRTRVGAAGGGRRLGARCAHL